MWTLSIIFAILLWTAYTRCNAADPHPLFRSPAMNIQPYIFFDGNCAEAMRFYEAALRGKLEMLMPHSEMPGFDPAQFLPGTATRTMHARLAVAGQVLMASDTGGGMEYHGMKGFAVT